MIIHEFETRGPQGNDITKRN